MTKTVTITTMPPQKTDIQQKLTARDPRALITPKIRISTIPNTWTPYLTQEEGSDTRFGPWN